MLSIWSLLGSLMKKSSLLVVVVTVAVVLPVVGFLSLHLGVGLSFQTTVEGEGLLPP